uniref:Uncharacterized protein n=1 Tax=Arion vulgaris TaxID=1028688 RepID=A0A0B6YA41_9EUPU
MFHLHIIKPSNDTYDTEQSQAYKYSEDTNLDNTDEISLLYILIAQFHGKDNIYLQYGLQ